MKLIKKSQIFSRMLDAIFWSVDFPDNKYHVEFKNEDGESWVEVYER